MAPSGIPEDVSGFIAANITSVMQLELLMLLIRTGEQCSVAELTRELRINADHAYGQLQTLARSGLLVEDGSTFWYEPASPALRTAAERLASLYDTHRVAITTAIYSPPAAEGGDRAADPLQGFSDAFRFRRDGE